MTDTDGSVKEKNLVLPSNEIEQVQKDILFKYLDTFTGQKALKQNEKEQFLEIASAFNLNPFKREIYAVAYGEGQYRQLSIITGYEVYLKRAERTGLLDGWRAWTDGSIQSAADFKACIEIHRKDRSHPFYHEVFFDEVKGTKKDGSLTAFWKRAPKFQLKKVAISQGFRLCFPEDIGGMPYTSDELPDQMTLRKDEPTNEVKKPDEIIPPSKFEDKIEPETNMSESLTLAEGEEIPKTYWSLAKTQKDSALPDGCKASKISHEGKSIWVVTRV